MKLSKKNCLKSIICIGIIAIVVLMSVNMIHLNQKYPSGLQIQADDSGVLEWAGYRFHLEKKAIMESDQLFDTYSVTSKNLMCNVPDEKYAVFELSILKLAEDERQSRLYYDSIAAENGGWANRLDPQLVCELNKNITPLSQMQVNQGQILVLAFSVNKGALSPKQWDNLNIEQFHLVLSAYPEKVTL